MNIYDLIKKRRSIRKFEPKEIEQDKLERVLNAARLAPSGKNVQAWKFIVVRDPERKEQLVDACKGQKFMAEADAAVAVAVNEEEVYQGHGNYMTSFAVDGAIALDHLILAATHEGLGTCWIGAFDENKVRKILKVPEPYRIVALTPLGYPAQEGRDRGRKSLEEVVVFETWE